MPGEPAPPRGDQLAAAVPLEQWQAFLIKEGRKGPLVAELACQRGGAGRAGLPGPAVWIVFRRTLGDTPELQVYLSNAPLATPVPVWVRVAGMRWPIETALEEANGAWAWTTTRSGPGWGGSII